MNYERHVTEPTTLACTLFARRRCPEQTRRGPRTGGREGRLKNATSLAPCAHPNLEPLYANHESHALRELGSEPSAARSTFTGLSYYGNLNKTGELNSSIRELHQLN